MVARRRVHKLRRLAFGTALCAAVAASGMPLLRSVVTDQVEARLEHDLGAALGREVDIGEVRLGAAGIVVDDLTVRRRPGEAADLLTARRVRVSADWWQLVTSRRLTVRELTAEGVELRVPPRDARSSRGELRVGSWVESLERAGLRRIVVRDARVEHVGRGAAEELEVELRLDGADVRWRIRAGRVTAGKQPLDTLALDGHGRIAGGELVSGEARLRAAHGNELVHGDTLLVTADAALARGEVSASGRLVVGGAALATAARLIVPDVPQLQEWWARRGELTFRVRVPLAAPGAAAAEGHFQLDDARVRPAGGAPAVTVSRLEGDLERRPGRIALRGVSARMSGAALDGALTVEGGRFRADGTLRLASLAPLRRVLPKSTLWDWVAETGDDAPARITFRAGGRVKRWSERSTSGSFSVQRVVVRARGLTVPVDLATGRFAYIWRKNPGDHGRVALSDVRVRGPAGELAGSVVVNGRGHRLTLTSVNVDPALVAAWVPGRLEGGRLTGAIDLTGDGDQPLRRARARFALEGAAWTPPGEPGRRAGKIAVARLAGRLQAAGGRLTLTGLELEADGLRGAGAVRTGRGETRVEARLSTPDLGRILDALPELAGHFDGGDGRAELQLVSGRAGTRGTVTVAAHGGVVRAGDEAFIIDRLGFSYVFAPRRRALRAVRLRGPTLNVDAGVEWQPGGAVAGAGQAWLTRRATKRAFGRWRWPLHFLGVSRLETDFVLRGTTERLLLDTSIAHSRAWRLIKRGVPKRARRIARGEAPIAL